MIAKRRRRGHNRRSPAPHRVGSQPCNRSGRADKLGRLLPVYTPVKVRLTVDVNQLRKIASELSSTLIDRADIVVGVRR